MLSFQQRKTKLDAGAEPSSHNETFLKIHKAQIRSGMLRTSFYVFMPEPTTKTNQRSLEGSKSTVAHKNKAEKSIIQGQLRKSPCCFCVNGEKPALEWK